jgi:ElaB/YqjD/DUF883 family membrane-anchored ribosome-binding protein
MDAGTFDNANLFSWENNMASNSSSPELGESIKEMRAQIEALTQTLGTLAEDTAEMKTEFGKKVRRTTREAASLGEQIVHEAANLGSEAVNAAGHAAANRASAVADRVEGQIARNPVTALLVALGIGLAVGLLSRK